MSLPKSLVGAAAATLLGLLVGTVAGAVPARPTSTPTSTNVAAATATTSKPSAATTLPLPVEAASPPTAATAAAAPAWTPLANATIHPGVMMFTDGAQCTANFVFVDSSRNVYLGQAAHCAGTEGATATDGCTSKVLPVGTKVAIDGASQPGVMVYNSWVTMQGRSERDANTCSNNDFALVRVHPDDVKRVNPTVPFFGGPTGLATTTTVGDQVLSYQNSSLRLGLAQLRPKEGTSFGTTAGGWSHDVYTITPGVFGDSGSGFVDGRGRAFGVLSTVGFVPAPLANGVSDLSRMLAYMNATTKLVVRLALGTEAFRGGYVSAAMQPNEPAPSEPPASPDDGCTALVVVRVCR